ncbi:GntR family transcriptional regulator [Streptomyces crystallinus]|uniref:HTH gntR-type domain-containing protein n=1 Tax=Streptomyces crystallinus TaxID=68191 RepID=A0ABN1GIQ2_9ACTN
MAAAISPAPPTAIRRRQHPQTKRAVQRLRARIADGTYPALATTPPMAFLAIELGVPTEAMVEAVHHLQQTGIIASCQRGRAVIAHGARDQIKQGDDPLYAPPEAKVSVRKRSLALAAQMREDINTGAWPQGQVRTRRCLTELYQEPPHIVAGAVQALKDGQLLHVPAAIGAWPLPAPVQAPARWSYSAQMTLVADVEAALKARIADPEFPGGECLASEVLATEFGVSRSTVVAALQRLREQHLIEGKGLKIRVVRRAAGQP